MKKLSLLTFLFLCVATSLYAQPDKAYYAEKYYLDISALDIPEFLEMHKQFTDASMTSDKRTLTGHFVKRHMYAGKNSIVMYDLYDSLEDKLEDDLWGSLFEYASEMEEADSVAFIGKAQTWFRMYLEGHTDEIRVLRPIGFGTTNWQSAGVIVNAYYTPTWADMNAFIGYWTELGVATEKCGNASASRLSTHYSGSGTTVEVAEFFNSWDDFAKDQKEIANCRQTYVEDLPGLMQNYWSVAGDHWDEIYIPVGSVVDGTFEFSEHFKN